MADDPRRVSTIQQTAKPYKALSALKTALVLAVTLVAMALGGVIGKGVVQWFMQSQDNRKIADLSLAELNTMLRMMAVKVNEDTPKMVDELTRLDKVTPGDREFTYHYTVIQHPDIGEPPVLRAVLLAHSPNLAKGLCADSVWRQTLNKGVRVNYSYTGPDGKPAAKFTVTSRDCN